MKISSTVSCPDGQSKRKTIPCGFVRAISALHPVWVISGLSWLGKQQAQLPQHLWVPVKPWIQKTSECQEKKGQISA